MVQCNKNICSSGIHVKLEINQRAAELAAQDHTFTRIARTAARFFAVGYGAVTLRLPDRIVYIGRHGIPSGEVSKEYDLGEHGNYPQIFKDLGKSQIKVFRQLSQLQGGIGFFACVPIYDYYMNRIGLLSVRDHSPMDHPAGKLAMLQELAGIAFEHLVLLLQILDYPMQLGDAGPQPSIHPAGSPAFTIDLFQTTGLADSPSSFDDNKCPNFNEEPVSNFLTRTLISKRQVRHRKNVTYFTVRHGKSRSKTLRYWQ